MAEAMLIVRTDESGANIIDQVVQEAGGSAGIVTKPKHLDGDVSAWIVAVTAFTQALPPLLIAIKELLDHNRVTGVEIDGVKVDHPTPELVERMLRKHLGEQQ